MNNLLSSWQKFAPRSPVIVDLSGAEDQALAPYAGASGRVERMAGDLAAGLAARGLRRVDLLRVAAVDPLKAAEDLFFKNRIDAALIPASSDIAAFFSYHQFNLFVPSGDNIRHVRLPDLPAAPQLLALHHRFTTPVLPGGMHMDMAEMFKRYSLEARGVLHVGAHEGEEADLYARMGFKRVLFIEANPVVYARLAQKLKNRPGVVCLLCAISDKNGFELLHVTSNDESSSLLPLKRHAELYPNIKEERQALVVARRLDYLIREIGHNPADYNFLHLDIQGAELKALQGAAALLPGIEAISTEVNYEELYEGCPLVEDLDDFLGPFGFQRVFTATPAHPQWGDAFYLRHPAVSFQKLGQWGRFGNQVFEYAFVKTFGKRHHLRVETTPWPGNQLFGACDPLPRKQYPQHLERTYALADSQVANMHVRPINMDVCGVFQYHTAYYAPHKEYVRQLWTPVPALKAMLDAALTRARGHAKTLVALHLRRGDYGYGMFFVPPTSWYHEWLKPLWGTLDAPALYIATDEPAKVLPDFAAYHPITAADLKLPAFGADYYPDFYTLGQADHVAISNSSFSFSACMMNERSRTFLRPDLFAGKLMPFEPWNDEPLLHRELGILDNKLVTQALPQYLARPAEPQLHNAMRNWRAQLSESWAQIKGDQLDIVLARDLWTCYQDLRKANLRPHPLLDVEKQILQRIMDRLAKCQTTGSRDAIGPFIGATLFVEPAKLPAVDLSSLPRDIQEVLRS